MIDDKRQICQTCGVSYFCQIKFRLQGVVIRCSERITVPNMDGVAVIEDEEQV